MHIYVKALNQTICAGKDVNDIPQVLKNIWNKEFEGVTGHVVIDNYGERMGEFVLHDFNYENFKFEAVISSKIMNNTDVVLTYDESVRPVYWYKKNSGYLPDSPRCGYNNAKCPKKGFKSKE